MVGVVVGFCCPQLPINTSCQGLDSAATPFGPGKGAKQCIKGPLAGRASIVKQLASHTTGNNLDALGLSFFPNVSSFSSNVQKPLRRTLSSSDTLPVVYRNALNYPPRSWRSLPGISHYRSASVRASRVPSRGLRGTHL